MKRQVLVVEDSGVQARILQGVLVEAGFDVVLAENGRVGLSLARQHRPTLVISDIEMPDMDGYDLCRAIKSDPDLRHTPVILLSMLSEVGDIIAGLRAGADNYVTKPYQAPLLLSRIESLLSSMGPTREPEATEDLEIVLAGTRYSISAGRSQLLNLLLSTFENAVQKNGELVEAVQSMTRLQRTLSQKNKALEAANEEKNRVLGMAAHDLRNPIGVSLSYTRFLQEGMKDTLSDTHRKFLDSIERTNRYMLKLVEQLLDISAIEAGQVSLHLEEADVVELVRTVVDMDTFLAARKNIRLELSVEGQARMVVDAAKLEQIIHNLITNAIKFSHPDTVVTVALRLTPEGMQLTVADQGQGIPVDEQHKLFKAFERTSVQSTAGEKSTGLGLAIVRHLVLAHDGDIWVESEEGRGATFHVRMPVKTAVLSA